VVFVKRFSFHGREYYALAESVREGKKVRTRILRKLGPLSDVEAAWWKTIISTPVHDVPKQFINLDSFACFRSFRHGVPALVHALYSNLGFRAIVYGALSKVRNRSLVSKLIEVMIVNRLDDPCSKLGLLEWLPLTSLPFVLDLPCSLDEEENDAAVVGLNENSFYRAMDILWERRDAIEKRVYKSIVRPLSRGALLAKDITSTYFEGDTSPIAKLGYSRDHRPDLMQVNFSLIETEEGYPFTLEVYPGNTADVSTVRASVKRLRELFGLTSGIFVSDRGMADIRNIWVLRESGFKHVLAVPSSRDLAREAIEEALGLAKSAWQEDVAVEPERAKKDDHHHGSAQAKLIDDRRRRTTPMSTEEDEDEDEQVRVCEVSPRDGDRFIVVYSAAKKRNDIEHLDKVLARGERILSEIRSKVSPPPQRTDRLVRLVQTASKQLQSKSLSPYFRVGWDEAKKEFLAEREEERIAQDRRCAGMWVLRTDLPKIEKSALEILSIYRKLWLLEDTFRELKGPLELRPIWHRKPDRIKAHIWICMMAYLIERIVEQMMLLAAGEPITATRVFNSFSNIDLNQQGFKDGKVDKRWWTVTELSGRHIELMRALKVERSAFKPGRTFLG
jgi:transposase